jgi:arabinogalactan endo-1,4-beta-galactosidase
MKDVLVMAQRAKALGMEIMIDFHYSDWWADPEKQIIPEAWKDFDLEEMKAALAKHTAETLTLLKDNGINVKWVQVGNETRDGFLWPMGQLSKGNMANYAALTIAGYDAVKSVYPDAEVIVHLDNGFDNKTYNEIFDGLKQYGAQWDIIGMSVYPYWAIKYDHEPDAASTLRDAIDNIRKLNEKYGCKVMIVETGVDSSKPAEGLEFMNSLFDAVINDANGACTGVFYWAPEAFQMKGPDGQLHGYALGAFEDGHPTAILNSYPRAARLMR